MSNREPILSDEGLDTQDLALLKAAGFVPYVHPDIKLCSKCRHGWLDDKGRAHCGASPDTWPTPIWAARKYHLAGMLYALAGSPLPNSDCEDLDNTVAQECKAYGEESRNSTPATHTESPQG